MNLQLKIFPFNAKSGGSVPYVRSAYIPPEANVIMYVHLVLYHAERTRVFMHYSISLQHLTCVPCRVHAPTPGSWEKKTPARIHNEAGDHVDNVNCFNQR